MTAFTDLLKTYPALWEAIKLGLHIVAAAVVVTLVLRMEKKATKPLLDKRNNINLRFVESIVRFLVILIDAQWVMMSSPLTKSFGTVLFNGTTVIAAIAGFAAQPVIADMICGLMLSATKPFDIGDRIELDDGTAGIVKDITMRHVVLQGIDTMQIIVPNSRLNAMKLTNMSRNTTLRSIHFQFNVGYGTDVEQAMAVIGRAIQESPFAIPGKPSDNGYVYGPVYFIAFAESSLVMATTVYYEPKHTTESVKSDINLRVKSALEKNGIEIPYNYVNVVMPENAAKDYR